MSTSEKVIQALQDLANPEIAEHSFRFFKAGPGEYAEDDKFLGVRVPDQRKIARKNRTLPLSEIQKLLQSDYHEVRLTGLFILVYQYKKADHSRQKEIFRFYNNNLNHVNNWDLVDSSAKYIAGHYLFDKDRSIVYKLANSNNLWERRVSVLTTFYFIDRGDFSTTLDICEKLLDDNEDLIHKATGWMLREIGKKDKAVLTDFLNNHYKSMPRTMLRYAIEKLPEVERQRYLKR